MKRREFVGAGVALGSSLLASSLFAEESNTEPKVLRLALVGCGRQGRALVNAGLKIPGLQITAVCDILTSARNSTKRYIEFDGEKDSVAAYSDFGELLTHEKGKIDGVLVATPDFAHHAQCIAALEAGLPVYCEPMMATTPSDARDMVRAAKRADRLLQIGFERRSDPRYRHVFDHLLKPDARERLLGRITHFETQANRRIQAEFTWPPQDMMEPEYLKRYGYESMSEYRNWKQYKRYGSGQCVFHLAQQVDVFEWFFGVRPKEIRAMGGLEFYPFGDCDDSITGALAYAFPHGTVRAAARVWVTTSGGGVLPFEHVYGEQGSVQTSLSDDLFRLHAEPGLAQWNDFVRAGALKKENVSAEGEDPHLLSVRETGNVVPYLVPVVRSVPVLQLHLENFVKAAYHGSESHCTAANAFPAHIIAWKVAEAMRSNVALALENEAFAL